MISKSYSYPLQNTNNMYKFGKLKQEEANIWKIIPFEKAPNLQIEDQNLVYLSKNCTYGSVKTLFKKCSIRIVQEGHYKLSKMLLA